MLCPTKICVMPHCIANFKIACAASAPLDHRDACIKQLLHVLPAMGIGIARWVLISETINQRNLWVSTNYRRYSIDSASPVFKSGMISSLCNIVELQEDSPAAMRILRRLRLARGGGPRPTFGRICLLHQHNRGKPSAGRAASGAPPVRFQLATAQGSVVVSNR